MQRLYRASTSLIMPGSRVRFPPFPSFTFNNIRITPPIAARFPCELRVSSSYLYDSSDQYQQGFNLNDTLKFTDSWLLRVGASQDWFHTNNFNTKSVQTTEY